MAMQSKETDTLRRNITDQLDRLVKQLQDLEEYRSELDETEYEEMKADTHEQLNEFATSLERISSGDMTLSDEIHTMRAALQAAISEAFKTPEIIALFARKQPATLRLRLQELERDYKMHKCAHGAYTQRKLEILTALQRLGEQLEQSESEFVDTHSTELMKNFVRASSELSWCSGCLEYVCRPEPD